MGCDGGTIPRRDELVRLKKKPEKKDKDSELEYRWKHCAITQQKLQEPIVMCGLGRLYSKQNVIEALLEKDKMPSTANHIKSLKDIKYLNLTPNPGYNVEENKNLDVCSAPYICRLIGLEMSGKFRFIALWSCGCVFSERAFKEIKGNVCSLCQQSYSEQDVIILNGNEEEINAMRAKMEARLAKRKSDKKSKTSTVVNTNEIHSKPQIPVCSSSLIQETAPLSKPTKANKRILSGDGEKYDDPDFKKSKGSYSVAKDPKASDVYKSLFTSHHTEQDQTRAHWVTYNPFYN